MANRKTVKLTLVSICLIVVLFWGLWGSMRAASPVYAAPYPQVADTDTPTATASPTETATATVTATQTTTVTATQALSTYERPIVVIKSYSTDPSPVNPGQNFDIHVKVANAGDTTARNVVISFTPGDFLPRTTGGVIAINDLSPGSEKEFTQPLTASWEIWGKSIATIDAATNYTDNNGTAFTEKFTLSIYMNIPKGAAPTATPTPTVTATASSLQRPQLVITNYESDVIPLQPGASFNLTLQIENLGNIIAKRITMIVGGGSTLSSGTPGPEGVSGASGEFTNFAPLGTSNIQSLGDMPAGSILKASQPLVVNVTTNPGAYPMKISFTYVTESGATIIDEQVITLLVYALPSVDINFYRDPGPLFTNQPNMLPIQINNLGRKSSVFGNLRVSAPSGILENNVILVGPLEAGGYFTLDTTFTPDAPGTVELTITVDYTDDFNLARQITRQLTVEVQEFIPPEESFPPGGVNGEPQPQSGEETFLQKAWRFLLGLLGLDSGKPQTMPEGGMPEEMPVEEGGSSVKPPIKGP